MYAVVSGALHFVCGKIERIGRYGRHWAQQGGTTMMMKECGGEEGGREVVEERERER